MLNDKIKTSEDCVELFQVICPNQSKYEWNTTFGNDKWMMDVYEGHAFKLAAESTVYECLISNENIDYLNIGIFDRVYQALKSKNHSALKGECSMNELKTQSTFFSKVKEGFAWLIAQIKTFLAHPFETFGRFIDYIKGIFKKINISTIIRKIKQFLLVIVKKPKYLLTIIGVGLLGKDNILESISTIIDLGLKALKQILPAKLYDKVDLFISKIVSFFHKVISGIWDSKPIEWIRKYINKVITIFVKMKNRVLQWVKDVMNKLFEDKLATT